MIVYPELQSGVCLVEYALQTYETSEQGKGYHVDQCIQAQGDALVA